jgi:hypothetical protein
MSTAIEHGATRGSRWLRERRLKAALIIAAVEGLLVVLDVIPKWVAFGVAAAVLLGYLAYARNLDGTRREIGWIAAASQAFVVLIPLLVLIVGTVALIAVGILAVLALVFLFADRR